MRYKVSPIFTLIKIYALHSLKVFGKILECEIGCWPSQLYCLLFLFF